MALVNPITKQECYKQIIQLPFNFLPAPGHDFPSDCLSTLFLFRLPLIIPSSHPEFLKVLERVIRKNEYNADSPPQI